MSNADKVRKYQKVLRRVETTDKEKSVEAVEHSGEDGTIPNGIVMENGKIIGLGIHIFNEDVYPLQSFEITLRSCELTGDLDLSDCTDMIFLDLSHNAKLKYFYCHNNRITELDTRSNPLLRHLNATGNPMKTIRSLAPQREEALPLELYARDGGCVGLKFNPVYNAQWKETGEWQQSYYAYPDAGYRFDGWYEDGKKVSEEEAWIDEYGRSRVLKAEFRRE